MTLHPFPVRVELYFTPRKALRGKRHQGWRFRAVSTGNRRKLTQSEAYTNRKDAEDAAAMAHPGLPVVEVAR